MTVRVLPRLTCSWALRPRGDTVDCRAASPLKMTLSRCGDRLARHAVNRKPCTIRSRREPVCWRSPSVAECRGGRRGRCTMA